MVGPLSINAYLPSFPDIETAFGVDRAILAQSLTVYLIAFAASTLFWGPLSDRIGRRKTLLASMSMYLLASIACAFSPDAESFILLRGAQAAGYRECLAGAVYFGFLAASAFYSCCWAWR
jgi:DHA1 family bicyclomycin/chloramphenicol resistance-like MFS transporter